MPRSPRFLLRTAAIVALSTLGLLACAGKPMAVQDPVSASAPMLMTKKGKVVSFGSWTHTRTKGGAIRTIAVTAGPWGAQAVQMDFEYDSSGGPTTFSSKCAFDASGQSVMFSTFGENSAFACAIKPAGGEDISLYLLREGTGRNSLLNGKLEGGGQSIDVTMTRKYADGSQPLSPVGYHFTLAGAPVAAVQINNPAQVWMVDGLDEATRDLIAAGIAALVYTHPAVQQTFASL